MSDSQRVAKKKAVWFTHEIIDESGEVVERNDIPVAYVHGVPNQMFPQLEREMKGKTIGEEAEATLSPDEHGFQFLDTEFEKVFSENEVPPEYRRVGAEAEFQDEQSGETGTMMVQRIEKDGSIVFMKKHPFAGLTITYRVMITNIRDASAAEIRSGHPEMDHPSL
ncbi:MAG: peptidylprolyl isomerase [Gammaproteobacteria bacterium]|jgi:FKBP-type peptidyl-prolyl cis-trans isomerase SlyD|nr:peptidylprolyl isomerase [Gammaproteobacteria bacterium]MBT4607822.1 peptidylprolyl isomerase [Thiotrichales bacterium]MBT3471845.1 peptidylprolyl isomerase [Gammaproteobacteria bacterium]MBT3966998.1 peptidylprolyl isomerase [Gammaproteobacteria bacterium]MBT4081402.1 peptidylprolyl isomerase [Gammaproteobacteria bacterium]